MHATAVQEQFIRRKTPDREKKKNIFANLLLEYFICNPFNKGSGDLIS
jgi:hypothetical protein